MIPKNVKSVLDQNGLKALESEAGNTPTSEPTALVKVSNVSASYARGVDQVLSNVDFEIHHGEYTELLLSSVPEMDPDWMDRLIAERQQKGGIEAAGN
jgi:hypothetical protein